MIFGWIENGLRFNMEIGFRGIGIPIIKKLHLMTTLSLQWEFLYW